MQAKAPEGGNLREDVPIDLNWGRKAFPYNGGIGTYRLIDFTAPELHQYPVYNQRIAYFDSFIPSAYPDKRRNDASPLLQSAAAEAGLQ